ncbi:MAG: sulfotransferase [Flavobacteriales bacterium]|nr:sulfotransferase [Flavobacteriales bacterium]
MPVLFIVGCARAGSTILFQSLAHSGQFAYPTNLMSRFYRDPYFGAMVHRLLYDLDHQREIFSDEARVLEFKSRLGRSQGAAAPHDFGYFWRNYYTFGTTQSELLRAPSLEEVRALVSDVAGIESVFARPVLLKGMEMNWHIPTIRALFPNSIFLFNHREILHNAMSILDARRSYSGDENAWYSYKPTEFDQIKELPAWEQVVAQVWLTERAVQQGSAGIPTSDFLDISYEDLCREPEAVHTRIYTRLNLNAKYQGPISFQGPEKAIPNTLSDRADALIDKLRSGDFDLEMGDPVDSEG